MIRTLLECTDNIALKETLEEVKQPLIESLSRSTRLQGGLAPERQLQPIFSVHAGSCGRCTDWTESTVSHLDLVSSAGPSGAFHLFLVKKNKIVWRMENSGKCIEMLLSFGKVNVSKQGRRVN